MNEVFARLNEGGVILNQQEIRHCIYSGELIKLLFDLNRFSVWRNILNKTKPDKRLRDIELLVRGLAFYDNYENYKQPMKQFLDSFMKTNQDVSMDKQDEFRDVFQKTLTFIYDNLGENSFRGKTQILSENEKISKWSKTLSPTLFDSVFIVVSRNFDNLKR